ncbi:MAG: argininosuccinate lyase [Bacteroidales bacterium]|nr:argininosuccinate lyase [Bacteroidales bacterium]
MKLWNKGYEPDKLIEEFTVGQDRELDLRLARYDAEGSMAHIRMLATIGLITDEELPVLLKELEEIRQMAIRGEFVIEDGIEDVHSQVEVMLTRKLGDMGKKIHSGRSRNDQVLVDLKLLMRDELRSIAEAVVRLFDRLQSLSEEHKAVLMPGYTHNQIAMPSSFGLWFGAYAESLIDDMEMLVAAYRIADQNPLGSAAGYGSSFPLNREMTTELLGFRTLHYNVVAAQMSRGKTEKAVSTAIAAVAATLGRFSMDICQFMCQNFGFIKFPDEFTTGSSIMPHKKNPDVFEIMRGKCNRLQAVPNELALLTANLPLGYNRDLQLMKDIIFPAMTEIVGCLNMADFMLGHIQVNRNILDDPKYDYLFTVEDVNRLAFSGVPFREAYKKIGFQVQNGTYQPTRTVDHSHVGSIGNLANSLIRKKMMATAVQIGINVEKNFAKKSENCL